MDQDIDLISKLSCSKPPIRLLNLRNDKKQSSFREQGFISALDESVESKILSDFNRYRENVSKTDLKYNNEKEFKQNCEKKIAKFNLKLNKDNMIELFKDDNIFSYLDYSAALYRGGFGECRLALDLNISFDLIYKFYKLLFSNHMMKLSVRLEQYNTIISKTTFNTEAKKYGMDFEQLKNSHYEKVISVLFNEDDYNNVYEQLFVISNGQDGIYMEEVLANDDKHQELFENFIYTHMIHCMYDKTKNNFIHIDYQILQYDKEEFSKKFCNESSSKAIEGIKARNKFKLFKIDDACIPIDDGKILYEITVACFYNHDRLKEYFFGHK